MLPEKPLSECSFEKKKSLLAKALQRRMKHMIRRLEVCRQELALCRRWEELHHEGVLLQSNLYRLKEGMKEVSVSDWMAEGRERTIALDPLLAPHEQVEKIFRISRKRKAAVSHMELQVATREGACGELLRAAELLEGVVDEGSLVEWEGVYGEKPRSVKGKEKREKSLPYHQFFSEAGLVIKVGKGAKSNDMLTFTHAKGTDWWFHVRDYPGSHVVLSVDKGKEPDTSSVRDAMLLALAYSKACGEKEAEVVVTYCKYVKRMGKNAPGKVQLSKHRVMNVRFDLARVKAIKQR